MKSDKVKTALGTHEKWFPLLYLPYSITFHTVSLQFTEKVQEAFRSTTAMVVNRYCAKNHVIKQWGSCSIVVIQTKNLHVSVTEILHLPLPLPPYRYIRIFCASCLASLLHSSNTSTSSSCLKPPSPTAISVIQPKWCNHQKQCSGRVGVCDVHTSGRRRPSVSTWKCNTCKHGSVLYILYVDSDSRFYVWLSCPYIASAGIYLEQIAVTIISSIYSGFNSLELYWFQIKHRGFLAWTIIASSTTELCMTTRQPTSHTCM